VRAFKWNQMKRFGFPRYPRDKYRPEPKTWSDILPAYVSNKTYVYNIKKITLEYSKRGHQNGETAARDFLKFHIPPLRYWNPDVAFEEVKFQKKAPKVIIDLVDGKQVEVPLKGMKDGQSIRNHIVNHPECKQ